MNNNNEIHSTNRTLVTIDRNHSTESMMINSDDDDDRLPMIVFKRIVVPECTSVDM
jgi:hypothetical protein